MLDHDAVHPIRAIRYHIPEELVSLLSVKKKSSYCVFEEVTVSNDISLVQAGDHVAILGVDNAALAIKNDDDRCVRRVLELLFIFFRLSRMSFASTTPH